jgi:hypothetical protein
LYQHSFLSYASPFNFRETRPRAPVDVSNLTPEERVFSWPSQWENTELKPPVGIHCSCCGNRHWYRRPYPDGKQFAGWSCSTCHPEDAGEVIRTAVT